MARVVTLGAGQCDPTTGAPVVRVGQDIGDDELSDYGETPMVQALGITAIPAATTDEGHAEGILLEDIGGLNGVVIGGRDTRTADITGTMGPGETCVHSTGFPTESQSAVHLKEDLASIVVGNDLVFSLDRGTETVTLSAFGHCVQVDASGIKLADKSGSCWIELADGKVNIVGTTSIYGGAVIGNAAAMPVALATPLVTYLTALEVVLNTVAAATVPPTAAAVAAFVGAQAANKALIAALTTKGA